MQKMSIEAAQVRLEGPTMGTQWSVLIDGLAPKTAPALQRALQHAVQEVDSQMSTWSATSDLMRFNAAPLNTWIKLPLRLVRVLAAGLAASQATGGAFEMNVGNAVRAWGFGADKIDLGAIRTASAARPVRAIDALELDMGNSQAKKSAPLALDLSGIAKGYGVDRLAEVLQEFGISQALCSLDGEVRALGTQGNGDPWAVTIELPDDAMRHPHSVLALADCAVATSGDYRHFVKVKDHRLSHTIDPRRSAPLIDAPASVSVLAQSCMQADALATALMVMGVEAGVAFSKKNAISALFLIRAGENFETFGTGVYSG